MSTNALLLHGLPEKLLLSHSTRGLHMVAGLLPCREVRTAAEVQSTYQLNYIRRPELMKQTISWLTMTPWITVCASGLVLMDWKIAQFRVWHWLYALHSCQTIITIILFLFSILLPIKPFSSHLISPPNIFASTISSDFQLFNYINSYSFLLTERSGSCFCLYLLSAMLLTKCLGNLSPLASWHKQGARSWTLFRSSRFILLLDVWTFHEKVPINSFWGQICGPVRSFVSYYVESQVTQWNRRNKISRKILKICQCKPQVNWDCRKIGV